MSVVFGGALPRPLLSVASDRRLARRAAGGDPEAFATIFRRYEQDLYRFCVGILREPQDAQDAVQNTMVRALRALPGETREMQLRPWLYRIAHNESVELRRRERPAEQLAPTIDDSAGTEERVEHEVRLQTLLADIADLPERQRAALVMRELNGLAFGEIAAALATSPGAVRQALYEARRALGEMELGRDMDCEAAMRQVSDGDGQPRRRGVRAHLRDCSRCRCFQAEIRERQGTLAAISPLPALVAAGLLKSALGGTSAAAGGAGAGTGAGLGAGALAGPAGFSGAAKAAAGLLAVLAVGAAVDHGALLPNGASATQAAGRRETKVVPVAARVRPGGPRLGSAPAGATPERRVVADLSAFPRSRSAVAERSASRGLGGSPRSSTGASGESSSPPSNGVPESGVAATQSSTTGEFVDASDGSARSASAGVASEAGGASQGKGSGVGGVEHPEHPAHPEHPEHPATSEHPEHAAHPEHPTHPETGEGAEATGATSEAAAAGGSGHHPAHPEHPENPAHPEQAQGEAASVEEPETVEETPSPTLGAASAGEHGLAKGHEKGAEPTA